MSVKVYLVLLAAMGFERVLELFISRRNQNRLARRGARKVREWYFPLMVVLHAGILIAAALEVIFLHRQFIPALAVPMAALLLCATVLRWWVIRTLAEHWNVQVMASTPLGVVTDGPYRWIRHPNYTAIIIELATIPLIYTAWCTAVVAMLANAWLLSRRVKSEERVLLADPDYRAAMGAKPRFLPGLF